MQGLPPANLSAPIHLQIVSNTPGRLRAKIASQHQNPIEMKQFAHSLKDFFPQIDKVRLNYQAGTITVYYTAQSYSFAEILSKLQAMGVIIIESVPEKSQPAKIPQNLYSLSQAVKQATKESVDLRVIIPFFITAIALKRLLPPLARWKTTTLYLLLWYTLESLVKLSDNQADTETQGGGDGE